MYSRKGVEDMTPEVNTGKKMTAVEDWNSSQALAIVGHTVYTESRHHI